MPDVYADIASAEPDVQAMLADAMVTRAADAEMGAMRRRYFARLDLKPGSSVSFLSVIATKPAEGAV